MRKMRTMRRKVRGEGEGRARTGQSGEGMWEAVRRNNGKSGPGGGGGASHTTPPTYVTAPTYPTPPTYTTLR